MNPKFNEAVSGLREAAVKFAQGQLSSFDYRNVRERHGG